MTQSFVLSWCLIWSGDPDALLEALMSYIGGASYSSIIRTYLQIFDTFLQVICSTLALQTWVSRHPVVLSKTLTCNRIKTFIYWICMMFEIHYSFILLQLYTVKEIHVNEMMHLALFCQASATPFMLSVYQHCTPVNLTVQNLQRQWILFWNVILLTGIYLCWDGCCCQMLLDFYPLLPSMLCPSYDQFYMHKC